MKPSVGSRGCLSALGVAGAVAVSLVLAQIGLNKVAEAPLPTPSSAEIDAFRTDASKIETIQHACMGRVASAKAEKSNDPIAVFALADDAAKACMESAAALDTFQFSPPIKVARQAALAKGLSGCAAYYTARESEMRAFALIANGDQSPSAVKSLRDAAGYADGLAVKCGPSFDGYAKTAGFAGWPAPAQS